MLAISSVAEKTKPSAYPSSTDSLISSFKVGEKIAKVGQSALEYIQIPEFESKLNGVPDWGVLMERPDQNERKGIIYLKVSEAILDALFPCIRDKDVDKGSSEIGAHISVIRPAMGDQLPKGVDRIEELGKKFSFKLKYFASLVPDHDIQWERVWILGVESPELEALREKYGLSPKLFGNKHDFHITIATKAKKIFDPDSFKPLEKKLYV